MKRQNNYCFQYWIVDIKILHTSLSIWLATSACQLSSVVFPLRFYIDIRSDFFSWICIPRLIQDAGLEGHEDHSIRSTVPKSEPDKVRISASTGWRQMSYSQVSRLLKSSNFLGQTKLFIPIINYFWLFLVQELLPELSGLLPLPKHSRGELRALSVLQEKLRDHLPQRLDREMGWAEGSRYLSFRPYEVNEWRTRACSYNSFSGGGILSAASAEWADQ